MQELSLHSYLLNTNSRKRRSDSRIVCNFRAFHWNIVVHTAKANFAGQVHIPYSGLWHRCYLLTVHYWYAGLVDLHCRAFGMAENSAAHASGSSYHMNTCCPCTKLPLLDTYVPAGALCLCTYEIPYTPTLAIWRIRSTTLLE